MDRSIKRNRFILAMAGALLWFAMYAYVPVLPAYAVMLGADAATIGVIGGAYGVLQIALRIPLGLLSDRVRHARLLLIVGFSVLSASAIMFLYADNVAWLFAARLTAGGAAAWWVIITTAFAGCYSENHQLKAQGVLSASANTGKVIASLACAIAAQWSGYTATFWVSFAGAATGLLLMLGLAKSPGTSRAAVPINRQLRLFLHRPLLIFSFLSILSQMQCFALPTTFTVVMAQQLGATSTELGLLVVIYFGAVSVASTFIGTKLYQRAGGTRVLAGAFIAAAISCVPFFYTSLSGVWTMQVLAGASYGIVQSQLAGYVIRCVPAGQRGMATGIFQSLFAIGIFLGPVLAGLMIDAIDMQAAYWAYTYICGIAAALCPLLLPKKYDHLS